MEPSAAQRQLFEEFFRSAPPDLDVAAIRAEWLALEPPYHVVARQLPLPVWARRPFTETGEQAWATLSREVRAIDSARPFCIYVHLPFCARRCSFCDCYSFPLGRGRERHVGEYLARLGQEMQVWSCLGTLAERPVSTVHLGGGTPTVLDAGSFTRLIRDCRQHFHTTGETEWALESTSSELTAEMVALLEELGFTRLHVGVQTLDDGIRQALWRRESAAVVLDKIARLVERGWIASVDLIYGLPGQTLTSMVADIDALIAVGVEGFSLYELQMSPRNQSFAGRYGLAQRDPTLNYFLFQAGSHLLAARGYEKPFFNHFARQRDRDLYVTFPERGEDCLALGAIADGVFSDYHYRHPIYRHYTRTVNERFPGLQGGLRRSIIENRLYPLEVAVLSTRISPALFARTLGPGRAATLLNRWQASSLVEPEARDGVLHLTANGSWFAWQMMRQLCGPAALP